MSEPRDHVEAGSVGPGAVAGSGSVAAGSIAGRDVHVHAPDEASNPRLRAVIQELAALDEHNGGVHLSDYFDLKRRYPELSAEIDAAMQVQLAQQQRRFEARMNENYTDLEKRIDERLSRLEREVRRTRQYTTAALMLSPVLILVVVLLVLALTGAAPEIAMALGGLR
jgi:hypothetical protein